MARSLQSVAVRFGTIAFLAAVLGFGIFLFNRANRPDEAHRPELGTAVETWAAQAHRGDRLTLSDIASFAWDRVVILPPYASNRMAADLGVNGWDVESSPTAFSEVGSLVGFERGGNLVAWTVVGRRSDLPPAQTGSPIALDRPNAVFVWSGMKFDVAPTP